MAQSDAGRMSALDAQRAGGDDAFRTRVEQQRVAMLYGNTRSVRESALLMMVLIAVLAWSTASLTTILWWCAAVAAGEGSVQWLSWRFHHTANSIQHPRRWGMYYAAAAALAGTAWGAAPFVLTSEPHSLAVGLIAACIASRAIISVMTHAHFAPALYAFVVPIFGALALRYTISGDGEFAPWGAIWIAVLGYLLLFGERQARAIVASIQLRERNAQLVEELKRQNAAAEEASRSKSRFFAAANHDLRQPLHSLGLFATALRNKVSDHGQRRLVDQILQCTESLESLFDNLLDLSKLDAGQVEIRRETFKINTLFDRLRSTFAVPAQEKGLRLRLRPSDALITSDPTLLFRILSNLVANAIRYTDRGTVLITCRSRGRELSIEVWDTGIGIPEDQHERIFEEFYQIDNPERDRKRGVGLGLATVRRIANLLGHQLHLRSHPGRGSVFGLRVPRADAAALQPFAATLEHKVPNLLGGKSILVIDDEASVRLGMQSLLESWGCRCITAVDDQEALRNLNGQTPDFIIADLRLRADLNGIEVIRTLRKRLGESIPAVLVSGDTATEQLRKVSAAGLTMMHKPLKAVRLRALLNHEFAKLRVHELRRTEPAES